jgi:hypothetical protein
MEIKIVLSAGKRSENFIPRSFGTGVGSDNPWDEVRLARLGLFSMTVTILDTWPCVKIFIQSSFV